MHTNKEMPTGQLFGEGSYTSTGKITPSGNSVKCLYAIAHSLRNKQEGTGILHAVIQLHHCDHMELEDDAKLGGVLYKPDGCAAT